MSTKVLDLVPVGYFVLDEAGHVEDVNAIGASLVGESPNDLADRRFADLIVPNDTWRFLKHLRNASRSRDYETCRIELKSGSQDRRITHLFTRAERTDDGRVLHFHTAVLTVAAELIEAKEEAEQMSRLKTAFLANMSHEIRTPLTGIIGFATVLAKELPEEHKEFAELIRSSGRRLLEMLNSVLDLAKLESNQMRLEHNDVNLAGEIRKVVDLLAPLADEKNLPIEVEMRGEGPHTLRTDRAGLNRILHNLVGNAIKFTDEGRVRVIVWSTPESAGFEVIDTGIGIEKRFIPQLFDEFSQESSGMDRSHSGAGLGLAITKRLVDLMGGQISVESDKGEGSRFKVILPRRVDGLVAPAPIVPGTSAHTPPTETPPNRSLRVLLVEDHADTQQLLVELLESRYDVSVAGTASEAFLLASQKEFNLVLMDIDLGEGPDGIELLQQLRVLPEYRETPIIAVTAYALPGDKERFLELGFTSYVSKPFDVDELVDLPMQFS